MQNIHHTKVVCAGWSTEGKRKYMEKKKKKSKNKGVTANGLGRWIWQSDKLWFHIQTKKIMHIEMPGFYNSGKYCLFIIRLLFSGSCKLLTFLNLIYPSVWRSVSLIEFSKLNWSNQIGRCRQQTFLLDTLINVHS